MNITDQFIEYLFDKKQRISLDVLEAARKCLIDYLGVTYAGAFASEATLKKYTNSVKSESGIKCIGIPVHCGINTAAFINGYNAHILELDDGHQFGMIHLGAPVISAVIAAAQKENADGIDVLKGIVMGYEAAVRLALAIQPYHKQKGFHTSGTCGTIGAAVGTAVILKLDKQQLKTAVSAAVTSAAGLLAIQEDDSELKPYNTGHAAMSGVNASYTGLTGLSPPHDVLLGTRGLMMIMAEQRDVDKLVADEKYYEIERIYTKPYAACRHCHSAIEAALHMREDIGIDVNAISSIRVYTYKMAIKGHDHTDISTISSAKLSIPFCVAAAYYLGSCGFQTFSEENIRDETIKKLTKKIHVYEKEEYSAASPEKRISELQLVSESGETYTYRVDYAKGDPRNPMNMQEVKEKYLDLMKYAGKAEIAYKIMAALEDIEPSAEKLYSCLNENK